MRDGEARLRRYRGGIIRGDASRRRLALLFSGSAHAEGTAFILDSLRASRVRASFFLTGEFLAVRSRRDLVERMAAEGHYVGPHSHGHLLYCDWKDRSRSLVSRRTFLFDLVHNLADLRDLGALNGHGPLYLLPPYEWYNEEQSRWAREQGVQIICFSPGTESHRDWVPEGREGFVTSARLLRDLLALADGRSDGLNGCLLLFHLGSRRKDKVWRHLPRLLDELARRGYRCVGVDDLLKARDCPPSRCTTGRD